ncbi:MAG: carbon-nitrogen hydrolase family protein [Caulobacteraceae bacterium]|nr:carbon-nitrogen hydrolase family protein [Caulobacteraceae bacterium]
MARSWSRHVVSRKASVNQHRLRCGRVVSGPSNGRPVGAIRIAAAQTPEFIGDLDGALVWMIGAIEAAAAEGAALLCLPEGFLQGYLTTEAEARRHALDLSSPAFRAVLDQLPKAGPMVVFGLIERGGERLFNTAVVVERGVLVGRYRKRHLLKGEACFEPGDGPGVFTVGGLTFGVSICHDTTVPAAARQIADLGASLIVCPANNMMRREAAELWKDRHNAIRAERCRETGLWMLSADVTGERDGRLALGPTSVIDPAGKVVAQLPLGAPGLLVYDLPLVAVSEKSDLM